MIDINNLKLGKYVWHYDPVANKGKLATVKAPSDGKVTIEYTDKTVATVSPEDLTWSNKS